MQNTTTWPRRKLDTRQLTQQYPWTGHIIGRFSKTRNDYHKYIASHKPNNERVIHCLMQQLEKQNCIYYILTLIWPSGPINKLSGFKSLWMTFMECKYFKARTCMYNIRIIRELHVLVRLYKWKWLEKQYIAGNSNTRLFGDKWL